MAKTRRRNIGDLGEHIALRYLKNKGFSLVAQNYLRPWGEIDLVMKQGSILHFVEVKTVSREPNNRRKAQRPEENMHRRKLSRLYRAIQTYLSDSKAPVSLEWQIDLACIYLDFSTRRAKVELFENIIL